MKLIEQLKSVLCGPDGKCCIAGSDEDRAIVDRALQALAQPVQPVGYVYWSKGHAEGAIDVQTLRPGTPLYITAPPQRKPLTDEEIDALAERNGTVDLVTWWRQLARDVEAAHNIKEKP